jgi:maltose/moltooligosaccharide transporter
MPKVSPDDGMIADKGETINIDGKDVTLTDAACTVSQLSQITPGATLTLAHIATIDKNTGKYALEQTSDVPTTEGSVIDLNTTPVLNAASKQYQDAGDWIGVLFAIQAIAAVIWAVVLPRFRNRRMGYSISLLIGAIGFISVYFFTNKYMLGVSYALVGCAWAAMLAMPFTILTNALNGDHIGTYLGLFNCTICVPQIIAALCGGLILGMFAPAANGAPNTVWMLVTAGVLLAIGAIAVWNIRETYGSQSK